MTQEALFREEDGEILPPEFDTEAITTGEYWDSQDDPTADRYEMVDGQLLINGEELIDTKRLPDSAVELQPAYEALRAAAGMYARYARAHGLEKAAQTPRLRSQINRRLGGNIDTVAARARKNAGYTFDDERQVLRPAIGADKLRNINKRFGADEEAIAMSALKSIRERIGVNVGHEKRDAHLKQFPPSRQ